ncbi:myosin phosphatase Rho-interacting protein isoform X5 [Rana temporaria]|uniref:myosin phosphatase Rho-interacting protein isoform X5 n=1 Tax=Rana temporaria TaxID=8407 RepID=UPI001AAC5F78|nr:myosin phosphatase Rho-interacting protein isoform X5 [Rana temporaria]
MSGKENPCKKFQANIFNKSKCQNCFKPRESHLLSDEDLNQAKPIYGGWLLLAPEGTDFDNPMHRSRKWQRRFFILYEHGLLRYALDEMPTTLPQGTINMNQCTDVIDAESRTGQKYSLCILTPEEHFIRAENKEIINGWLEMLIVYPKTNKQNQKKKRKVEPPTPQEPGPAKMAATSTGIPSAEKVPATKSTLWQEEAKGKDGQDSSSSSSPLQSPVQMPSSPSEPVLDNKGDAAMVNGDRVDGGRKTRVESGYFSLEKTKDLKTEEQPLQTPPSPSTPDAPSRRSMVIEKFEALDIEKPENMETNCSAAPTSEARQGRSEKRTYPRKRDETGVSSIPDVSASHMSSYRRAKSLDRRSTESSMTPDLLNFKKGWLTKQYPDGQWKKHWFVLTDQNLRYYRDSVAEEAADLDGEIDLSTCYDVTEFPVQRNYGFQIHTKEGEFILSAMTSGIRRNWIQTIMKHVRPNTAPDVTSSLPEEKTKAPSSFVSSSIQSDKQDSEQSDVDGEQKRSRARERRREGRSKTFDWAEFRPIQQALAQERAQAAEALKSISCYDTTDSKNDLGELERERARRREERRKRFESSDSIEEPSGEECSHMEVDKSPTSSDAIDGRPNVHVEIEQRWQQVETTPLREERQIPISPLPPSPSKKYPPEEISVLLEKQLEQSRKEVSDLLAENLLLQHRLKEALQQHHAAPDGYILQNELADPSSEAWQRLHKVNEDLQSELEAQYKRQEALSHQLQNLKHSYGEARDTIRHHEAEILSLQARLNSVSAELSIKEQALAKLKGDLKLEKEKIEEMQEEWKNSEVALGFQLKASQQKLKEVESSLLEKSQKLRELEMEQALQKDYQKESQRLQDKLVGLQAQLETSEQTGILIEERLQLNYEEVLDSYDKEKQQLILSLKETEDRLEEYENVLQEKEQLMEVLQKEKLNANTEASILVHHLEEQLAERENTIHRLEEHIKELERERDQLKSACEEMAHQSVFSDFSSLEARLMQQETECSQLRNLLEESRTELLKVQECLRIKDEELYNVCEAQRKILEKKDQDINEALIKMAALGSSLEETETKLKAKEETLKTLYNLNSEPQAKEIENVYIQLESAKRRIAELEQSLQAEGGDVFGDLARRDSVMEVEQEGLQSKLFQVDQNVCFGKEQDIGAKRQRIRFSSIQCQKYAHVDSSEKTWTSSTSSDTSQEQSVSEESTPEVSSQYQPLVASDIESFMSIIHSLETKLYITEEKLKDVTLQLANEKSNHQETLLGLHNQWAKAEASLKEQLKSSITQVNAMAMQIEDLEREKHNGHHLETAKKECFCCLETCQNMLKELHNVDALQLNSSMLCSLRTSLSNTIQSLEQSFTSRASEAGCSDFACDNSNFSSEAPCEDLVQRVLERIHFQENLMRRMAESFKNMSDPSVHDSVHDSVHSAEMTSDILLVEKFAEKVRLEREFWDRVDELGRVIVGNTQQLAPEEPSLSSHSELFQTLADNTVLKAELNLAIQKTKAYCECIRANEHGLQEAKAELSVVPEPCSSKNSDLAFQEYLSRCLKENAEQLRRISSALMSMPQADFEVTVKDLMQTTQQLSSCVKSCNLPPILVQDAVVQAQLCYIACKTRLEYEREATRSREALCQIHSEALAKIHQQYQEILQKKESELSDVLERERTVSDTVTAQVMDTERLIVEAEAKFRDTLSQLDDNYKKEIQNLVERWAERERLLKLEHAEIAAKLHSSEQELEKVERFHREQLRNVEKQFQDQIQELQVIHQNEIGAMEEQYTRSIHQLQDTLDSYQKLEHPYTQSAGDSTLLGTGVDGEPSHIDSMTILRGRVIELEAKLNLMREELEQKHPEENTSSIKAKYQADFENLKATCERGFAAMEETHQKKIEDLQRQHHRELEKLRDEKDRLLEEETAATISAIEAMKNAHREELYRELEKNQRSQCSGLNADVDSLRRQYLEELQSVQRELEVLSEQYSQKCLENAHLAQALEAERQALRQCQRENQELNAHNQELNNRLASEITRLRNLVTGDGEVSPLTQGKDVYELEVLLRVKESEIQYQKQEISSLKDELQTALRDKKYASDKYKDIYTELSNVKAKAECDITRLKEQLKTATEMLGEKTPETESVSGYDIMKSKSNPDFLKNDRSSINRQLRNIRSKSLKEGLTVQERLKIFESQDYKKH